MRLQSPSDRQQALDHLDAHQADFLADSRESALFTAAERRELEQGARNCHEHCKALLISMETGKRVLVSKNRSWWVLVRIIDGHFEVQVLGYSVFFKMEKPDKLRNSTE